MESSIVDAAAEFDQDLRKTFSSKNKLLLYAMTIDERGRNSKTLDDQIDRGERKVAIVIIKIFFFLRSD